MKHSGNVLVLVMILWGYTPTVYATEFLKKDLSLIHYDEDLSQPQWVEGGAFSEVLQRDSQQRQLTLLTGQMNLAVNYFPSGSSEKVKVAFNPKVVLKPFIIVDQLQDLFIIYQSKKREETASIEENGQAKALMSFAGMSRLKQATSPRTFLLSPYYHKVYGIHLQIHW